MKQALTIAGFFALPLVAFAQTFGQARDLGGLIAYAGGVLNQVIPVLIALALVIFFWGLIQYIRTHKGGKDIMIAGLVGLFIMVSVWGIIRIAQNTLGVRNDGTDIRGAIPNVPQYQPSR
jgi:hypothetical protein